MLVWAERLHSWRRSFRVLALALLIAAWVVPAVLGRPGASLSPPPAATPGLPNLDTLPLTFEPNAGQVDPPVRYIARTLQGAIYFTPSEVVLTLDPSLKSEPSRFGRPAPGTLNAEHATTGPVRMQFLGANPAPQLTSGGEMPGRVSYLMGSDPSTWRTGLPTYADINYLELYPGVDLAYTGREGVLKGTYTVSPGADPAAIRWRYAGAQSATIDANGNLQITPTNPESRIQNPEWEESAPIAWQEISGQRIPVQVSYSLAADGVAGFLVGSYDPAYSLVIDPTLKYSSFLGGSGNDFGYGVDVDEAGNIYIVGQTYSANFPMNGPLQPFYRGSGDVFVTKLNASGTAMLYSLYLGGSGADIGWAIAVDRYESAYILGDTASSNFPTAYPFQPNLSGGSDAFVAKISPDGIGLVYSTYLGGSGAEVAGNSIAVDPFGNAYVLGLTSSVNFPKINAVQPYYGGGTYDAFVTKVNPSGSGLIYSTFLGGTDEDWGVGLALGGSGNLYVTGSTRSYNFPTANAIQRSYGGGFFDAYLAKITANGTMLIYSTYLGGGNYDGGTGVAVDADGNAFVTGVTYSENFPMVNPYQSRLGGLKDAFVAQVNAGGASLSYSTYLGGRGADGAGAIAVDADGQAHVVGDTNSADFPVVSAIQPAPGGGFDGFVTKLNYLGSGLVYSTYLGGKGDDFEGTGAALFGRNNLYTVGFTASDNFPVVGSLQTDRSGARDSFIARIYDASTPIPTQTPSPTATPCTTCPTPTATPCAIDFVDVYAGDYYYQAVRNLFCGEIITGYNDGSFRPYANTTRAQLAKIVVLAEGWPIYTPSTPTFADVPAGHPFYGYIETAFNRGLVSGYSCGSGCREFRPDNNVTRGQLAKFVVLAQGWGYYLPPSPTFSDVPVYNVFYHYIETAYRRGIISGYGDGTFRPISPAIRGQICKIVYNAVSQ